MSSPSDPHSAAAWFQRGLEAEAANTAEGLTEALDCYDRALTAAAEASAEIPPGRRGLIRVRRGNVLLRVGQPAEALAAYDAALEELGPLTPLSRVEERSAIGTAWLNRAGALRAAQPNDARAVLQSLDHAIAALRTLPVEDHPVHRRMLAAALVHRGDGLLRMHPAEPERAAAAAREAATLAAPLEAEDPATADVGLKARLVLLGALGPHTAPGEATDWAESGVALARHWVGRGVVGFGPPAHRLIELAGTLYQIHQPHFLAEFWREHLDPPAPPPAWTPVERLRASALRNLRPASRALLERQTGAAASGAGTDDRTADALKDIEQLVRELEAA